MTQSSERDQIAATLGEIAVGAGSAVMAAYGRAKIREKADLSPVTDADTASEAFILARLATAMPDIPVLAEEQAAEGQIPAASDTFIAVDPVDGTREFLELSGEFTVNIALIVDRVPVAGAVYAPALNQLWLGGDRAETMAINPGQPLAAARSRRTIAVRTPPDRALIAMVSRRHDNAETDAFLATLPIAECRFAGSSLKFCLLAEGDADVYPRIGPTMEWDTAAGHAVLRAAGGMVLNLDGTPLTYGKAASGYRNGPFVAWGRKQSL